ncbi:methyl-accepting chemotaxis protein [Roseimarinus sediminis]|uniref:methyl-accepting chemotaxis protein n=1 Tax=Roseimarinus sediminis TaxID=1610899 RepID=UPI003D24F51D
MNEVFKDIIIVLGIGIPTAIVVLRILFKNSILFNIAALWVINLFILVVSTKLTDAFPEAYPQMMSLPFGMGISAFLIYLVYKQIRKPLDSALKNVEELSKGNLLIEINTTDQQRNNELGILARSLGSLSENLMSSIGSIKNISMQVNQASLQLRATSDSLSLGTSSEAASIEEISSSMEEIVVSTSSNTEGAERTNSIALEANASVKEGNSAALNAIGVLNNITEKIEIINDIAFQTNILALNAAVEAARAGEHGRGFSVVAAEVRNLAERSKKAAAEIIELSKSAASVSQNASEKLAGSIPLMETTTELISSIYASSREQGAGAEQVNNAIGEINLSIQSNATTAEEMSASAEELEKFAAELIESISIFNMEAQSA